MDSNAISNSCTNDIYDELYNDLQNITPIEFPDLNNPDTSSKFTYRSFLTTHPKLNPNYKTRKITEPVGRSVMVGNLTWWTTDEDLIEAAAHCDAKDVIGVKFAENRVNGLSKGCALIEVESELSYKTICEKFPLLLIHGSAPQILQNCSNKIKSNVIKENIIPEEIDKPEEEFLKINDIQSFDVKIDSKPKHEIENAKPRFDDIPSKTNKPRDSDKRKHSPTCAKSTKRPSRSRRRSRSRSPSYRSRHRRR